MGSPQQLPDDGDALDAVVIGAGWAGLGVSYWLARGGLRHSVLERGRVGETWRTQRWHSFRMNTPNVQTVLPGEVYDGPDPEGTLTRDQFVSRLEDYAARNTLPIRHSTAVNELTSENGVYRLGTAHGALLARNVIVASGSLNCPLRPDWAAALPPALFQVDASGYRSAADLPDGATLVVGSGQSGAQIAEELAQAGRAVYLATSRVGRLPRRYRGRDIMIWLLESGFLDVRREEVIRVAGRIPARGVLGSEQTISLQKLSAEGVVLVGRLTGMDENGHLTFADDLDANVRFADEASDKAKLYIDDYIGRAGINAPPAEPDPAETVPMDRRKTTSGPLDLSRSGITSVVWCTGLRGDFSWIKVPGALDGAGQPVHTDGVAAVPGLYFAGLDFASTRKSGIILAIAEEAPRLVDHIARRS